MFALQIFLFALVVLNVSGVQRLTVTPDRGSSISISSSQVKGSGCAVCYGEKSSQKCGPSALLTDSGAASVEFKCTKPHDVFSVEIIRKIECTAKSCNGHITQTESGSLPLEDFNRTFTWNLKAPTAFQIDFTKTGLRQIDPSESCPDKHTYTLQATGDVAVGKYCRAGAISSAQVQSQGRFSLHVPAGHKLQNAQFGVSIGEDIKSLAKIKLTVPEGTSSAEFFSPNYPDSFPDDDVMEWEFRVPAKHRTDVQFLNHTLPLCRKKSPGVEYQSKGRAPLVLRLTDTKPVPTEGDFSLTLRNCEMDMRRKDSPGLSLNFKVSAARTNSRVSCSVDLRKERGFSLHIEKKRPGSACEMKMNSVPQEEATVPADRVTQLLFQDCLPEDLRVTARTVIACYQLKDCPRPVLLAVPALPSCLPAPLSNVTWTLRSPPHGTVELRSPTGTLRQSLPGHPCNDSMTLKLAEDDGTCLGHFCPQGAIQKVQIHTNMSVTAYSTGSKPLQSSSKPVLSASFKDEISDRYIFWASPKKGVPVHLATPGWPGGMKSYSTVSWIVTLPPTMCAHLNFTNQNQPKCSNSHTSIKVQSLGSLEEMYSRREDEKADDEITVSKSFYLNMSNCMPETGSFSVVTHITLHKSKSLLLTVILSVVAALLVVFVVVLAAVCVVIRKKKKKMNHEMSIYNPNGTSSRPGPNGFPKSADDDEPHVYATIEDTLVYTHLLRRGAEMGIYGDFDTYQPFTGPTEPHKPPASMNTDPDDRKVGVYQPFVPPSHQAPPVPNRPPSQGQRMVDNEVYQSAEDQLSDLTGSTELGPRMEPEGGN